MPTYQKLGPYQCIRTLGEGTFAQVVLGRDERKNELVALKVIKHTMDRIDPRRASYLQTEVGIMRKIKHKHVIGLREVRREEAKKKNGTTADTLIVIVFDYAAGGELYETLYLSSTFEDPVARTYFCQLVQGVAFCHELRIAHRDLKPQNLLLDGMFNLKIGDFGFAKLLDDPSSLMHTNCGTPAYQAPELRDPEQRKKGYSLGADIWACGVILFFMLTGRTPFQRAEITDPICQHLFNQDYAKFWEMQTGKTGNFFSVTTQDIINKMLTVNPERRITVQALLKHPFMLGPQIPHESIMQELKKRRDVVKQKKKRAKLRARTESRKSSGTHSTASPLPSQPSSAPSQGLSGQGTGTNTPLGTPLRSQPSGGIGSQQTGSGSGSGHPSKSSSTSTSTTPVSTTGGTFSAQSIENATRGTRLMDDKYLEARELYASRPETLPPKMDELEMGLSQTYFESKETIGYILWRIQDELRRMTTDEEVYRNLHNQVPQLAHTDWFGFGVLSDEDLKRCLDGKAISPLEELSLLAIHSRHSRTANVLLHNPTAEIRDGVYHMSFELQGEQTSVPLEIQVDIYTKFGDNSKALDGSPLKFVKFSRGQGDGFAFAKFYDYFEWQVDDLVYLEEDEIKMLEEAAEKKKRSEEDGSSPSEKISPQAQSRATLYFSTAETGIPVVSSGGTGAKEETGERERQLEIRQKEPDEPAEILRERRPESRGPRKSQELPPPIKRASLPPPQCPSPTAKEQSLTIITGSPPTLTKRASFTRSTSATVDSSSPPQIHRIIDPSPHSATPVSGYGGFAAFQNGLASNGASPSSSGGQPPVFLPRSLSTPAPGHLTKDHCMQKRFRSITEESSHDDDPDVSPFLESSSSAYSPLAHQTRTPLSAYGPLIKEPETPIPGLSPIPPPISKSLSLSTPPSAPSSSAPSITLSTSTSSLTTLAPPSHSSSSPTPIVSQIPPTSFSSAPDFQRVQSLSEARDKKEFSLAHIWSEVEKKIPVIDDHVQWSDLMSRMNEAINLLYLSLYPAQVSLGNTYLTTQESEEFKNIIRGGFTGTQIQLSEYKFVWLKNIETYLKVLAKVPHTWFGSPRIFHGPMSRAKAEQLLSTCKSGTLLVRYSCTANGLCLSSRRSDGNVQHIEVKLSTVDGTTLSIQWDKDQRRRYSSLEAIIWQSPLYAQFYPDLPKSAILNPYKEKS